MLTRPGLHVSYFVAGMWLTIGANLPHKLQLVTHTVTVAEVCVNVVYSRDQRMLIRAGLMLIMRYVSPLMQPGTLNVSVSQISRLNFLT